ncbi:MAG: hypothetical protein ACPGF7_10660 [Pontibacterium sp.]
MGYIGNQTSNSYSSLDKQTITGDGGASYTLTHAVANAQEIEVFVNNVRQEPGVAYTVSGTALTMTGNVASTDDFYVVFQGKALQTTVPPDDSVTTASINDDAVTSDKLAHDINIVTSLGVNTIKENTGTTTAISIDSSGRVTTPARPSFHVTKTAASGTGANGHLAFNNEIHDVGGCWNSNYFKAPVDGVYHFSFVGFGANSSGGNASGSYQCRLEVSTDGGSTYTEQARGYNYAAGSDHQKLDINLTIELNADDRVRINVDSGYVYVGTTPFCYFSGHLVG